MQNIQDKSWPAKHYSFTDFSGEPCMYASAADAIRLSQSLKNQGCANQQTKGRIKLPTHPSNSKGALSRTNVCIALPTSTKGLKLWNLFGKKLLTQAWLCRVYWIWEIYVPTCMHICTYFSLFPSSIWLLVSYNYNLLKSLLTWIQRFNINCQLPLVLILNSSVVHLLWLK